MLKAHEVFAIQHENGVRFLSQEETEDLLKKDRLEKAST